MKVLILTSRPHWKFVNSVVKQYRPKHDFWLSEALTFPNEYDVGISFMHLHKIPANQINSHIWINFHPGPLPEYKGRNLCYHAIMNGEKEFGTTVHYMDENFDTGDIIEVFRFPIFDWYTAQDLNEKVINISKAVFQEYLPIILEGRISQAKKNVGGTYYKKEPISESIDLANLDGYICRQIRAIYFPPYYPKIEIGGVMYKIVRDE